MATLHQAIDLTRNVLKWGGISIGSVLLAITLFRGGVFVKEYFFPTPESPPTVRFGVLPIYPFPKSATHKDLVYSIDTVTGSLPTFSDRVNVYQISHEVPNLLDLKRARSTVANLEIKSSDTRVTDIVYSWSDVELFSRKIVMDIVSRNFIYTTDFLSYSPLINSSKGIEEPEAKNTAQEFLSKASSFSSDIDTNKTKTLLYKFTDKQITPATTIADTQLIRVDFFLKDIDKLPIYFDRPNFSMINMLVSNYQSDLIVEANYYHHTVTQVNSTYPIKSSKQAFEELQNGKGYIASDFNTESGVVKVRNVFLAYYLTDKKMDYLMPIIVFTDNDGFYAYVPAVTDEFIKK